MNTFFIGLLGAAIAANVPAPTNSTAQKSNATVSAAEPVDPLEKELEKLEEEDDAARAEVDEWIAKNTDFATAGAPIAQAEFRQRILKRLEPVRKNYEDFIRRHPKYAPAHLAYASFLNDIGDEDAEFEHLKKASELDPKIPAVWNNLGNYYGHNGPTDKAFESYEKALALKPEESLYFHNFGTTVYLFRKDAREYFHINEQQVFDKALTLYSNAMRLDPTNFPLASDVAQTYYGIQPLRTNDALVAWTNALALAHDDVEREGALLHMARVKMMAGRFDESRALLNTVTNAMYNDLKRRLTRSLNERIAGTNSASATPNEVPDRRNTPTNAPTRGGRPPGLP